MGFFKKLLKKRKLLVIIGIILVVVIAGVIIVKGRAVSTNGSVQEQRLATVTKGELNVTLSGSGTVSPVNRKEIKVVIDGVVTESCLEEGKSFKEGDVITKFDDSDALLNVKSLENALKQKELSMGSTDISNDSLYVKAPFTGRVGELNVKEGTKVNKGDTLLTLVDDSVLQTHITFENTTAGQVKSAKNLQVQIPDFMTALPGRIESVSQDGSNAEAIVSITNPGELTSGLSVWAEIETAEGCITSEQGTLEYTDQEVIKADAAGKVTNLSVYSDSKVSEGKILLYITDEALPYSVENDQLELERAKVELKLAREKLENYTIRAPFDGVVVSVSNLDQGDSVESGTSIAILMDTSEMTFDLSIDELDITTVEPGQIVDVTAEALENVKMNGKVTSIAPEGETSNGVTSYPVTVTIPGIDKLKSGMNVDAVIQIFNKPEALLVPVEAIQKINGEYMVWVKGATEQMPKGMKQTESSANTDNQGEKASPPSRDQGGESKQGGVLTGAQGNARNIKSIGANNYYSGAMPATVKVGMHNETFMEITEGLKEGDVIVLPPLAASTDSGTGAQGSKTIMMPGIGNEMNMKPVEGNFIRRGN